ncbi:MAG: 6-bladed beta-propeller [Niabella sp.]
MRCLIVILLLIIAKIGFTQKIRVNPAKVFGGNVADFFESVEYIPLENSKESTLGFPRRLIITYSSVVISDFDTYNIFFFNLSGNFLRKHSLPRNKGITTLIDYDSSGEMQIVVQISPIERIGLFERRIYSATGILLKVEKIENHEINIISRFPIDAEFYLLNKLNFSSLKDFPFKKKKPLIEVYNKDGTLYKAFLNVDMDTNPFLFAYSGGITTSISEDGTIFCVVPFDYSLYKLTKDSVFQIGQFIFPSNYLLPNVDFNFQDYRLLDSVRKTNANNPNLIQSVCNINFYKNKMIFTLQKRLTILPSGDGKNISPMNFIYDTVSHKSVSFERITPDNKSYFLPIMDGFSSSSGMNLKNGYLYSSISSLQMFSTFSLSKSKNPQYPPVLQQYFKTQNRKSNPVIVRMKLKE